ncbi:hypothetical protein GCM10011594_38410 [Nakamurella endophytica]|uniref:Lipoyl-binding domain-containing protein n=1 Tax=Nakamurella endophytica TaxID=1748367 RepID=A0A917T9E8_9ACTN|nr:hypothetical protein GCM10011594_38410 [Nakamurella endophytica]
MHEIRIPKFGMSTVEVDVTAVHVTEGQVVAVGDPIVDVDAEKTAATIDADVAGTVVDIRVETDGTYQVGDVVCVVAE